MERMKKFTVGLARRSRKRWKRGEGTFNRSSGKREDEPVTGVRDRNAKVSSCKTPRTPPGRSAAKPVALEGSGRGAGGKLDSVLTEIDATRTPDSSNGETI